MRLPARPRAPVVAVAALVTAFTATFVPLALLRHRGFYTARYDLGNMTQAVWSAAHGGLFDVTDKFGAQISRLGSHVDPILGLFAPLWRIWPSPEMLLVVQALAVATAAIPAYLLARRWLADERLAVAFAAVTLLYPALQWATLFDFHPLTLATPLLLWCIWAAVGRHDMTLAILAALAALTKEQVGLALAVLGIWMAVSLGRRRAGAILAASGVAWSAIAVWVIIPHYSEAGGSVFVKGRYGELGSDTGEVIRTVLTRPWKAVDLAASADGGRYLLALVLPLLALSLFAPLLAAGALPDLVLNLVSSRLEQHRIEYHYSAVIAPFLIAAAIRGLAFLRARERPAWVRQVFRPSAAWALALVAAAIAGGYRWGPLPWWQHVPGGSAIRAEQYGIPARAATFRDVVDGIPAGVPVSSSNRLGGHLSARERIFTFPVIDEAQYVLVDLLRPDIDDDLDPAGHAAAVSALRARKDFEVAFERDGVVVFRRIGAP